MRNYEFDSEVSDESLVDVHRLYNGYANAEVVEYEKHRELASFISKLYNVLKRSEIDSVEELTEIFYFFEGKKDRNLISSMIYGCDALLNKNPDKIIPLFDCYAKIMQPNFWKFLKSDEN